MKKKIAYNSAFTIVELLVVIVVIGVLASLTVVSFTGVSRQALVATVKSDLTNAATQVGIYNVQNGQYPNLESDINSGDGFQESPGTTYGYHSYGTSYCIEATSTDLTDSYHFHSNDGVISDGECPKGWSMVSAGREHACAITYDSLIYCWGNNSFGQLGDGTNNASLTPVAVDMTGVLVGKTIKDLAAGEYYNCVIASDNLEYCWGNNQYGQLGNGLNSHSSVAVAVDATGVLSGKTIVKLAPGWAHNCSIASDNQAYCWGTNGGGRLGNNSALDSYVPVAIYTSGVLSGKTVLDITSHNASCVIASDGLAYCWGYNNSGMIGDNSTTNRLIPTAVNTSGALSGKTLLSINTGQNHTCAVASDNQAYCWGSNGTGITIGQIGDGVNTATNRLTPVAVVTSGVLSGKTILDIQADILATCAIASDEKAYCWGYNGYGQLGDNTIVSKISPIAVNTSGVLNGKTINSISTGDYTCAIASDDQMYCWGRNHYGQLDTNSTIERHIPYATTIYP